MRKLTQKQIKFKENTLKGDNGTQAAIKAGYAIKSARVAAHNNITNNNIMSEIAKRNAELEQKTDITVKFIQDEHKRVMRLCEENGDRTNLTTNLAHLGKTIAAYADKSYNLDVIEHNPQSLTSEEDILRKRLAVIEAAKALPSGIEGR